MASFLRGLTEMRLMKNQEDVQRCYGDRFWGLERVHELAEARRAHKLERQRRASLAAEQQAATEAKKRNDDAVRQRQERDAAKRRSQEQDRMGRAEAEQCSYADTFWGVDKERRDEVREQRQMRAADAISLSL